MHLAWNYCNFRNQPPTKGMTTKKSGWRKKKHGRFSQDPGYADIYPTTDRSKTATRKKCPPSAAYVIPFRVILLSFRVV